MIKIYHNPRCSKSRNGLAYLNEKGCKFETVDYLKEGLTEDDLKEILLKTNLPVESLIRTQEEYFKKELKGKKFNQDEWIKIILENPKLLQRPIILTKTKGVHAIPADKAGEIL